MTMARVPAVHLYTACWNDSALLPFFLQHYRRFVTRFIVFDDGSDDHSRVLLERQPDVEVRRFPRDGSDSIVELGARFYSQVWKESRDAADWVCVPDIDEFLYHPAPLALLSRAARKGWSMIPAFGFEMVSAGFPEAGRPLVEQVRTGLRRKGFDKTLFFSPNAIDDIAYSPGRHSCRPSGRVHVPDNPPWRLLHYKHLGWDYLQARQAALAQRMQEGDNRRSYGHQYHWSEPARRAFYNLLLDSALDVTGRRIPASWRP